MLFLTSCITVFISPHIKHFLCYPHRNSNVQCQAKYSSVRSEGKNCCVNEFRYPQQNALCDGAEVMILKNFAVELGLMTGTVGVVKLLCYKHANGPYPDVNYDELQYAIVDFPDCLISENSKFFEDLPRTYIPIPIVEEMSEEKCCSVRALPLRCCKALSQPHLQGLSGNDPFECWQCITQPIILLGCPVVCSLWQNLGWGWEVWIALQLVIEWKIWSNSNLHLLEEPRLISLIGIPTWMKHSVQRSKDKDKGVPVPTRVVQTT